MLILTRKTDEGIVLDHDIVIRVLSIDGERVKLGITAPESILVLREELCDADDDKHTATRIDEIARLRGSLQERRQRKAQ